MARGRTLAGGPRADVTRRSDEKPKALGAYIFAGGFTVGVAKAGFDVQAHFEENKYGVATARHNFPQLPIFVGPENWPVADEKYHGLPWVYGNPPCAAWSVAGYTKTRGTDKWKTDPRVECTVKHFGLIKALKPKVWTWESVTQAWSKGREFVNMLAKDAMAQGYSVTIILHDAKHLGLPQERKRFLMVCHRIGFAPLAPNWSPPPVPLDFLPKEPVGEPMIEKPHYFTAKRLAKVKPGERLVKFWERTQREKDPEKWKKNAQGGIVGRPAFGHVRLPVDRPSGATVGYCIVHPTEDRFISTEEIQLLSGFPADYHFTPNGKNARAAEIARGLCPPVAEWHARGVKAAIEMNRPLEGEPKFIVYDFRNPPRDGQVQWREVSADEVPEVPEVVEGVVKQPRLPRTEVLQGEAARPRPAKFPVPKPELGSGNYIRLLLTMEVFTTEEIVKAVHEHFKTSKATAADVSYHRGKMKEAGAPVRVVRETSQGRRLTPLKGAVA